MVDSKKYVWALFPGTSEYHVTEDVIKNLERRSLSRIIQVTPKCSHMYLYSREAEGVLRQRKRR